MKKKNNTPKRGSGRKRLSHNRRKALSRFEHLETRTLLAADLNTWHNADMANDVNADGSVNEMDQTILVAELNANGNRYLGAPVSTGILEGEQSLFIDVNNDNSVSPTDLLIVSDMLALEAEAAANYTAEFSFEIRDKDGGILPTSGLNEYTVRPNEPFRLVAFVKDTSDFGVSDDPSGFYQAFLDVAINSTDDFGDPSDAYGISYSPDALITGLDASGTGSDAFDLGSVVSGFEHNILPEDINGLGTPNYLRGMGGGAPEASALTGVSNGDPTMRFQLFSLLLTAGPDGQIVFQGLESNSTQEVHEFDSIPLGTNLYATATFTSSLIDEGELTLDPGPDGSVTNPMVTVKVSNEPIPDQVNAFSDVYNVSEDLASDAPKVLHTDGLEYVILDVKVNDTDPEGNPLTGDRSASVLYSTIGAPVDLNSRVKHVSSDEPLMDAEGNAIDMTGLSDNFFLYRPAADFSGTESFSYSLGEFGVPSNTEEGTVTINVANVNDAPVAVDDGSDLDPILADPGEVILIAVLDNDGLQSGPVERLTEVLTLVSVQAIDPFDLDDADADIASRVKIVDVIVNGNVERQVQYTAPAIPRDEVFEYTISDGFVDPLDPDSPKEATARVYVKTLASTSASGRFFFDANGDGEWNPNTNIDASAEMVLGGITVTMTGGPDGDSFTTTTNADGSFSFDRFDLGEYTVTAAHPKFVTPNPIAVQTFIADDLDYAHDFGQIAFRGLAYDYRGFASHIASNTEDSIMFAVNMTNGVVDLNSDGSSSLEWYSVDEGWERLISIDSIYYDADSDSGLVLMTLSGENDGDPNQQASLGFSSSTSGFQLLGETPDGVVFRLNGSADTVLTDAVFATL